jgi:hypothetical protein
MYPQKKKSMCVKSRLRGGQLIGPPLLIRWPGNRSSRAERTMAPKWAGAPSCWEMRPSTSVTVYGNTLAYPLVVVLSWKGQGPTVRSDLMPQHTLTLGLSRTHSIRACGFSLPQILQLWRCPGFDSRRFQIFWEAESLERCPLSLVRTTEELLGKKK